MPFEKNGSFHSFTYSATGKYIYKRLAYAKLMRAAERKSMGKRRYRRQQGKLKAVWSHPVHKLLRERLNAAALRFERNFMTTLYSGPYVGKHAVGLQDLLSPDYFQ